MEYSVGNLTDFTTGKNNPKKPKVVQKEYVRKMKKEKIKKEISDGVLQSSSKKNKKLMEYSVGSLADLITGNNTPNKPKVIRKKFVKKIKKVANDSVLHTSPEMSKKSQKKTKSIDRVVPEADMHFKSEKKLKKAKKIALKALKNEFGVSATENKKERKDRKRKLQESIQDATISSSASVLTDSPDNVIDDSPMASKKIKLSKNDENAERRVKQKVRDEMKADPQTRERTIFVGNIPVNTNKKKISKIFKKYGKIEAIRIRGITPADPKTPKKVAVIKKEFHPNRNTVYCYIRFENQEDAAKAEVENGTLFEDHHLRVHVCESTEQPDESKAIFIGNLSFDAEDEELWKLFEPCGEISHIRIIRDQRTGMGKGFGYVNFKDSDAVQLALQMENVMLKKRELRISLCNLNRAKKNKNKNKKEKMKKAGKQKFRPRFVQNTEGEGAAENSEGPKAKGEFKHQNKTQFQGSKFEEKKKKNKVNKGLLQKKKITKMVAPRPK